MTVVVLAGLAGLAVLGCSGTLRRWPWRVADLDPGARPAARGRPVDRPGPRRPDEEALQRDLPFAADLLHLAVSSGATVHGAVELVARESTGPVAAALAAVLDGFERGGRLADELERLPRQVGPALRPLTTTLVVALGSGAPVGPALSHLAEAERRRARRRTEQRVRRLPLLLLAPLVGLVLPAFVCLTVVPVGLTAARVGLQPAPADALPPEPADPPRSPP